MGGGFAILAAFGLVLVLAPSALAVGTLYVECLGVNGTTAYTSETPCKQTGTPPVCAADSINPGLWYAFMETSDTPVTPNNMPAKAYGVVSGVKGTIDVAGKPYVNDLPSQHVDEYLSASELPSTCTQTGLGHTANSSDCHIQVGWTVGQTTEGCSGVQPIDPSSATVFIEIFDNSFDENPQGQDCGLWGYGLAPITGASYDTRYYSSFVSGSPTSYTFYRYKAYYQDPAGGGIQVLAYGDFFSPTMAILAGTEAAASVTQDGTDPICPVAARSGSVNHFGLATSPATFADQLKLYINGAWTPWTSSAVATSYYTSPDTSPAYLLGPASNPVSNATQFNAWGAY